MKKLVYQYHRGPSQPWVDLTRTFAESYARRVGADYRLFNRIAKFHPHHFFGTFNPFHYGEWREYDALLYLDTDVLIRPDARDIFREDVDGIGMVHLLDGPCQPGKADQVKELLGKLGQEELAQNGGHANAGVVYWSPGAAAPFAEWVNLHMRDHNLVQWSATPQDELGGHYPFGSYDQCLLNVYGITEKTLHRLDPHYNYHLSQFDHAQRFDLGGFIHYHGPHKNLLGPDLERIQSEMNGQSTGTAHE